MRRVGPGYRPMDLGITLRLQNVPNGWAGRPIISNAGRASEVAEGRRSWRPGQTRAALPGIEPSLDCDTLHNAESANARGCPNTRGRGQA
jgi:hypothetical protein